MQSILNVTEYGKSEHFGGAVVKAAACSAAAKVSPMKNGNVLLEGIRDSR